MEFFAPGELILGQEAAAGLATTAGSARRHGPFGTTIGQVNGGKGQSTWLRAPS